MEVEPASKTEFEEDILKQKESDAKDITEINGNNDEPDIEIDVKLSDTIKDKAKFNDNESPPSLSPQENAKPEPLDNDPSEKLITEINGTKEDKEDQENDANISDVKPKDESLKMEEEEEDEVKEEPMDQDPDPDPEPEPELPAFEDQDRSVKLEEPLFDEKLIDGFSFRAFDKYTVLEECCKWSAQNPGKTPDPWYKLKFRPKPVKPKPVKEKKEKKEKELTKKQKEKLEKVSSNSSSERGPNAADRVSDPHFAKKSLNGHSPGRSRPNGAVSGGSQPLNFSLGPHPSRYPGPAPGHAQARSGGLYRPYEVSPSAAPRPPQGAPGSSHQNPAPRQIYSAPSTVSGHYPQASHYNYHAPSGSHQVHPAYRPPGNTTAGPSPAHYKGYHHQQQQHHHHSGQQHQQQQQQQQQQQHYYNRGYPGQYPGYPPAQSNGVAAPHSGQPGHAPYTSSHAPSSHSTSQASYRQAPPQHSSQPSRDSYSSSYHNSTGDPTSKHNSWSSPGYPAPGPPASAAPATSSAALTASTLAPHSRPPYSQPGPPPPQPAPASLHRPTTDPRYPGSSSERGPAPGASVFPPAAGQPPGQPQPGQTQQQPQNSTILPPTPMMKDVPKLGGPDSLFYRAGLEAGSGFPPRLSLTSGPVTPGQFPASGAASGQPQSASQPTKKTGKWNAMHVRIAWEIYNHQKNKTDPKTIGGLPGSNLQPSGKLGPSSLDLLNKPGALPGAGSQPSFPKRPGQELTRPHQAPASLLPPASGHLRLPTPPSHFDPRDPYAAQRAYYGTSHLGSSTMAAAAASYPRYPSVAAPPFGGLGGIIPSPMVSGSHPAAARPMPGAHPSLTATSTPSSLASYPSYPGAHGALGHSAASREKEDRERAEAERRARERREAEERQRQKEAEQSQRDAEARSSREGFPAYVRDRNGDSGENHRERERSPVRPGSGQAKDRRVSGAGGEAVTAVVDLSTSQKTPTDMSVTPRPVSDHSSGAVTSRPGSVVSHHGTPPALPVKHVTSGELRQREERICDDISIIAEKPGEGNRSGANSVTGRASVSSDHSITRINGGPASGHENGLKSDSPAGLKPPGHHSLAAGAPHPAASPYGGLYPGAQARPGQPPPPSAASSYLAAAAAGHHGLAPPSHDPRTLAMFPHMAMSQSLRPPNPLDPYSASYAALDPYRDPFRLDLLARDPLREARDRELLRLGAGAAPASLGSLELERAKAYGLGAAGAGYPGLAPPSAYPGYPPTTFAAAQAAQAAASASLAHSHAQKMASAHGLGSLYPSSAGLHPSLAGYPGAALGYPGAAAGLNGAAGQFNGKDPLRR